MSLLERVLAEFDTKSLARRVKVKILQTARPGGKKLVKLDVLDAPGGFCLVGVDELGRSWKAACDPKGADTSDDWLLFVEGTAAWNRPGTWKKYTPPRGAPIPRVSMKTPHVDTQMRPAKYRGREGIRQWTKDRLARDRKTVAAGVELDRTPLLIETVAPVGWTARTGVKYSGLRTLGSYPAGVTGVRSSLVGTPENKKIAKSAAWQFLQPVALGKRRVKVP